MFNNLLESKAKRQRTLGGFIFSVVFHATLITTAAYATLHATQKKEKREEKVEFVEVKKAEPPKPPPQMEAPPPPKGFQVLTAPVNIPDVLPEIDLTKKLTDEADFSGKGVARGLSKGPIVEKVNQDQTYFEFQVEKPVMQAPGSAVPRYPEILKSAGVEGEVLAQFVVDTTGRAESESFRVLKATHDLFATAVRSALPNMRFIPAEVGGKKVKQLVQQPFVFAISR